MKKDEITSRFSRSKYRRADRTIRHVSHADVKIIWVIARRKSDEILRKALHHREPGKIFRRAAEVASGVEEEAKEDEEEREKERRERITSYVLQVTRERFVEISAN